MERSPMFTRKPERMMVEVEEGQWYLYAERDEAMLRSLDWLGNADAYGPFDDLETAEHFLFKHWGNEGYWTTGYDPNRDVTMQERMLIERAPSMRADKDREDIRERTRAIRPS